MNSVWEYVFVQISMISMYLLFSIQLTRVIIHIIHYIIDKDREANLYVSSIGLGFLFYTILFSILISIKTGPPSDGNFLSATVLIVLGLIIFLAVLAGHAVSFFEVRGTIFSERKRLFIMGPLLLISIIGLPSSLTYATTPVIFFSSEAFGGDVNLSDWFTSLGPGPNNPPDWLYRISMFWANETIQGLFLDIPSAFGVVVSRLEYVKSNLMIATMVICSKIFCTTIVGGAVINPIIIRSIKKHFN